LNPALPEPAAEELAAGESADRTPASTGIRQRPATARRRTGRSRLTHALGFVLAVGITVVLLRTFVIASYYIPSASMEPTLHGCHRCEPDLVVVDKLSYRFSSVARSDVVVFDRPPLAPPEDPELIKRVIGLPGETISGRDGRVFIGAKALTEPYVNPACGGVGDFPAVTIPAGKYFVMGDNRCDSLDSRVFGVISGSSIVGRAVAVSWPLKHLRWL
jgi:signal peptidase I